MSLFNAAQFNAALFGGALPPAGPVLQVASGLLYPALRKAGVTLGPGRTPSPAQFQDAIDELNRLTGSLNADRLFICSRTNHIFALSGAKTYTIGIDPNGAVADFDAPRPQLIEAANVIVTPGDMRYPLVLATDQQWAKIVSQDVPDTVPEVLYNDRAYPLSTLHLYGQPAAGYQLELFVWTQVDTFSSLTDVVTLPLQYADTLVLNLAVRLAPHFQRVIDPDVRQQARESLLRLESINAPQPVADTGGFGGCGCYNIYADTSR